MRSRKLYKICICLVTSLGFFSRCEFISALLLDPVTLLNIRFLRISTINIAGKTAGSRGDVFVIRTSKPVENL